MGLDFDGASSPGAASSRPVLRPAAVSELFVRCHQHGDLRARAELVDRFLPLARKLAARYRGGAGEPFDDLLQVASVGLIKAIDRFDPTRGLAFKSYAVPTILGELKRYFRDTGWSAHVPRRAQELGLRVKEAERALSARTGHSPTLPQLAEYLEVSVEEVLHGLEAAAAHHSASLDAPHDQQLDGESRTLGESIAYDEERFERVDASATIASVAPTLAAREREVLALRFNEDLTQREIAARIGVSQMQVSRMLRKALNHLQELADPDGDHAAVDQRPNPRGPSRQD